MYEPQQTPAERGEVCYTAFGGYDRNPVIPETSFYDETNLSADGFPLLQPRPKRAFFSVAGNDHSANHQGISAKRDFSLYPWRETLGRLLQTIPEHIGIICK